MSTACRLEFELSSHLVPKAVDSNRGRAARPYHPEDLRRSLIDVSVEVIGKKGLEALNLWALATRLGVSSGAPYHHFTSRADQLAAIAQERFDLLQQAMASSRDACAAYAGSKPAGIERLSAQGRGTGRRPRAAHPRGVVTRATPFVGLGRRRAARARRSAGGR